MERGFDNVTIDEIAEAADVGRVTVFNHFPRKEDIFFDRDDEGRSLISETLKCRDAGVSPVQVLHHFAHKLVADNAPYVEFSAMSLRFVQTVEASETLKARARAIRDELTQTLAATLSECVERAVGDPDAYLAASLALATWSAAFIEAHRAYRRSKDVSHANQVFLAFVDRGMAGLRAAMAGTPYA